MTQALEIANAISASKRVAERCDQGKHKLIGWTCEPSSHLVGPLWRMESDATDFETKGHTETYTYADGSVYVLDPINVSGHAHVGSSWDVRELMRQELDHAVGDLETGDRSWVRDGFNYIYRIELGRDGRYSVILFRPNGEDVSVRQFRSRLRVAKHISLGIEASYEIRSKWVLEQGHKVELASPEWRERLDSTPVVA